MPARSLRVCFASFRVFSCVSWFKRRGPPAGGSGWPGEFWGLAILMGVRQEKRARALVLPAVRVGKSGNLQRDRQLGLQTVGGNGFDQCVLASLPGVVQVVCW